VSCCDPLPCLPAAQIVNHARKESANWVDQNGSDIPGNVLCNRVSGLVHAYTLVWCAGGLPRVSAPSLRYQGVSHSTVPTRYGRYVRPFGANVLIANYADDGPQLYAVCGATLHLATRARE